MSATAAAPAVVAVDTATVAAPVAAVADTATVAVPAPVVVDTAAEAALEDSRCAGQVWSNAMTELAVRRTLGD